MLAILYLCKVRRKMQHYEGSTKVGRTGRKLKTKAIEGTERWAKKLTSASEANKTAMADCGTL